MQPEEARALLQESAAAPAPPTRVSVSAATDRGRRIVRTRRTLTAAGVVALAIAGAASAALSVPQRPAHIAAGSSGPPSPASPGAKATTKEFSPLTRTVAVGWVPEGLVELSTFSLRSQYRVSYHYPTGNGESAEEKVSVTVYAAGEAPWQRQAAKTGAPVENVPSTEAPAVNGRPARWIQPPHANPSFAWLRWEYRPDAWAEVNVFQLGGGEDPKQAGHRIASGVTMDNTAPIRLPFQLSGVPSSLPVLYVSVHQQIDDIPWNAEVGFGDDVSEEPPYPLPRFVQASLTVNVSKKPDCTSGRPGKCGTKFDIRQNTTVQGMPAWRETTDKVDSLTVYAPNGLIVHIVANGSAAIGKLGPDGVVRLAEKLTLMGEPENWTEQPLR